MRIIYLLPIHTSCSDRGVRNREVEKVRRIDRDRLAA